MNNKLNTDAHLLQTTVTGSADFNVVSFFDGMSCGQLALQKTGIEVTNYFACEIDKYATKVAKHNFPNTIELGDVTKVFAKDLPKIDLLIGGSPCQGFSFAGKQLNFEDPRSKLFFEFVRMLNEIRETNPDVLFLLENVKMKKEFQDVITEHLGVEPVEINSNLVSAQNRKRLHSRPFNFTCAWGEKRTKNSHKCQIEAVRQQWSITFSGFAFVGDFQH